MVSSTYIMESDEEGNRLEDKTDSAETERQLNLVGIKLGMKALDVGAGTGAVARVMARLVGEQGEVTAFDASEKRMQQGEQLAKKENIQNIHFVSGDLYSPPLPKEQFDFIWSRFVFEYLPDPVAAIESLIGLLKPGGKLVVGDLDGYAAFHANMDEGLSEQLCKLFDGLEGVFDPYIGRKLYGCFYQSGLKDIQVHCMPYHLYAGTISDSHVSNWQAKLESIRPHGINVLGGEEEYTMFSDNFLSFLKRPDTLTYSTLFLVSGTRS